MEKYSDRKTIVYISQLKETSGKQKSEPLILEEPVRIVEFDNMFNDSIDNIIFPSNINENYFIVNLRPFLYHLVEILF